MELDSITSPSWLDKSFIQAVLRNNSSSSAVEVNDVDISAVVGKGENYGSQLHRLTVHVQDGATSAVRQFVVKSLPVADVIRKLLEVCGTFGKELNMYQVTLPSMNKLLADSGCTVTSLCATSYPSSRPHTIIMDDLSAQGFKMADRHKGVDAIQSRLALEALARFHASSLVLLRRNPGCMDMYVENYYHDSNREWLVSLYDPMVKALTAQVSTWPGFEHFADKLRDVLTVDKIIASMKPHPEDSVVLNHGDPWMNNLLFQFSASGEATAVKFVDFQEMRVASPVLDLQYFLYTSLRERVCAAHWRHLLGVYHEQFVATLRMCGEHHVPADLASVQALQKKMDEKVMFGLLTSATILPIVMADTEDAPDFQKWEEEEDGSGDVAEAGKPYTSGRFKDIFQDLLRHFEEKGAFETS